jgi:hypothetical protein
VSIRDSTLTGSTIYYADGIRIQGASNLTIQDTTIIRPAGSEPASTGAVHNPPCAGIEIAASSNGNSLVRVDHVGGKGNRTRHRVVVPVSTQPRPWQNRHHDSD